MRLGTSRFCILRGLVLGTVAAAFAFGPSPTVASERRALLVGIDQYQPKERKAPAPATDSGSQTVEVKVRPGRGSWIDLDGAVNDVTAMRDILVARYGFAPENIRVLENQAATREAIVQALRTHIVEGTPPGENALFFYAGHGSQVRNSKTNEPDGMDETLVPADSHQGVFDIRDKELAALFNAALDRKVVLTVISDSCHSGSIARGLPRIEKQRSLPPDPRDVAEAPPPGPPPESRGLLVFSAAQDYQTAGEITDEEGTSHGAFSFALLRALQTVSLDEPSERVFLRAKAIMQSEGRLQEPVIAGTSERRRMPLFGNAPGERSGGTAVAVLRVENGMVTLQGGTAVGLHPRCELKRLGPGTAPVRLRIVAVRGLSASDAQVVEGDLSAVAAGDLFGIDRWAANFDSLRVFKAAGAPTDSVLRSARESLRSLRASPALHWVDDPTLETPTHVLAWKASGWTLTAAGRAIPLGPKLSADGVLKRLVGANAPKLFVQLPPTTELVEGLKIGTVAGEEAVVAAPSVTSAHYLLVGRFTDSGLEYAWMLPNATQTESSESALPLPTRTDWVPLEGGPGIARAALALEEQATRLARIRSWLTLSAPPDEGAFPYRLALKNLGTGVLLTGGTLVAGETFSPVLIADRDRSPTNVERRFVYVFTLDSYGNGTLLFPRAGGGNIENKVPYDSREGSDIPSEIPLKTRFRIGPPFGTDTYILLSSTQPIADPELLQIQAVRTRAVNVGVTPLEKRIGGVIQGRRGLGGETSADWSVDRLSFRSASAN